MFRSWFNISKEDAVLKATAARDDQLTKLKELEEKQKNLAVLVEEHRTIGENKRKALQARLNERAKQAEPALDNYENLSIGKIMYDQLGQLVAKFNESIYQTASLDLDNYGYRSKQYFSVSITADALSRHLQYSLSTNSKNKEQQQKQQQKEHPNQSGGAPFDHLVMPLLQEMQDAGMNPVPLTPLLEFAHEGCIENNRLHNSILSLRESLAQHRRSVGSSYASGKRVDWESLLDIFKFSRKSSVTTKQDLSLVEQADRCADLIEVSVKKGDWNKTVNSVNELWSILAPTVRGNAGKFGVEATSNIPLLNSMFDIRTAAEQRLSIDYFETFVNASSARAQVSLCSKLFELGQQQQQQPSQ